MQLAFARVEHSTFSRVNWQSITLVYNVIHSTEGIVISIYSPYLNLLPIFSFQPYQNDNHCYCCKHEQNNDD